MPVEPQAGPKETLLLLRGGLGRSPVLWQRSRGYWSSRNTAHTPWVLQLFPAGTSIQGCTVWASSIILLSWRTSDVLSQSAESRSQAGQSLLDSTETPLPSGGQTWELHPSSHLCFIQGPLIPRGCSLQFSGDDTA